jgi:hypothetical protein
MDFVAIILLAPPELCNHFTQIIAETFCYIETRHRISQNGLRNGFNEHFLTRFREKLLNPTLDPRPKFVLFIYTNAFFLDLPTHTGNPK